MLRNHFWIKKIEREIKKIKKGDQFHEQVKIK